MLIFLPPQALTGILIALLLFLGSPSASGELTVDQVVILANRNSPASLSVAERYAALRKVPNDHIIQLDLPVQETISREVYDRDLVQPTRQILEERRLAQRAKVVVTTYDIPLRVRAPQPTDQQQRWIKDASERQELARRHLEKLEASLNQLAPADVPDAINPKDPVSKSRRSAPTSDNIDTLVELVSQAIRDAAVRLSGKPDRRQAEKDAQELARLTFQFGGMSVFLQGLRSIQKTDPQRAQTELENLRRQVASADTMFRILRENPSDTNRQSAYRIVERVLGVQGIWSFAKWEMETYSYKEGDASLDNELSLLWWDQGKYRIAARSPNPFHYENSANQNPPFPLSQLLPVLMVSRLDAPTPQLAMQLADQAVKTEQNGLLGNVYVDARGLPKGPPLSYGFYDQDLRDLAELFRRHTPYEVLLENTERRFSQPGEAPNVAVYVGWYRLRSYEDAFTFNPGAIGYHIASGEAVSIHDSSEPGWCKNALEHGITVTLGSTGEPFLDSFPLPSEFLSLLLTGRYTMVEAYYLTTRYLSWRMALFGDPLYNPWRRKGLVGEQAWKDGKTGLPTAPSDLPFNDPIQSRQQMKEQRETALAQISRFMEQLEHRSRELAH
jgi:uncharacterized protein (TIGR03790 family)